VNISNKDLFLYNGGQIRYLFDRLSCQGGQPYGQLFYYFWLKLKYLMVNYFIKLWMN